jgi:hypothetical protein
VPLLSEVVASVSGASVSVVSGYSETVAGGLDVGLPWSPPVAALAIVPKRTTANAMRRILTSFMGSVSAGRPADTLAEGLVSGGIGRTASRTRLAERLVRSVAPGDDSKPGRSRPLWIRLDFFG